MVRPEPRAPAQCDGPDLDDEEVFEAFRSGAAEAPQPTSSSRGLTAKALLRFFDPSLAKDMSDGDNGFYATYRRLFERLAQEERVAAPYPGEEKDSLIPSSDAFPSFGYSHTPYSHAKGQEAAVHQTPAKDFYNVFMNFQSRKSFGWFDKYDLRDAPDRRVKRLMEKRTSVPETLPGESTTMPCANSPPLSASEIRGTRSSRASSTPQTRLNG